MWKTLIKHYAGLSSPSKRIKIRGLINQTFGCQCLCLGEKEFIWRLEKEALFFIKQQREVLPLRGQLPSGSRWGFQGTGMFPDAACAFGRQRPSSAARSCRQQGCPWALGARTIPKKAESSLLSPSAQDHCQSTLLMGANQAGMPSQESSRSGRRWVRLICFALVPAWGAGIGSCCVCINLDMA